jgi:hypothetical protein
MASHIKSRCVKTLGICSQIHVNRKCLIFINVRGRRRRGSGDLADRYRIRGLVRLQSCIYKDEELPQLRQGAGINSSSIPTIPTVVLAAIQPL